MKWLDSSNNPCYHLIKALEEYSLYNASEIVKEQAAKDSIAALNMLFLLLFILLAKWG